MKLYRYEDGNKLQRFPFLCTYIERMNESWQAKAFGITIPLFSISIVAILIIFPIGEPNLLAFILQGSISIWFIISYILLVNRQMRDKTNELKRAILRDSEKIY